MKTSMSIFKFKVVTKDVNGNIIGSVPFTTKRAANDYAEKIILWNDKVYFAEVSK